MEIFIATVNVFLTKHSIPPAPLLQGGTKLTAYFRK